MEESWLEDIAEDETVVDASVADDELMEDDTVEDDTIEDAERDDETELEATLLDAIVPEDDMTDETVEGTLLDVMLELKTDDESDENTMELEGPVDDAPLEDGVTEDSAVDDGLTEDIRVVGDPLEIAEAELAVIEEMEDTVDAAEEETDVESRLLVWI